MKNVKRILLSMILVVVIQLCFPCDTISATELSASGRITGLQNGDAANVFCITIISRTVLQQMKKAIILSEA